MRLPARPGDRPASPVGAVVPLLALLLPLLLPLLLSACVEPPEYTALGAAVAEGETEAVLALLEHPDTDLDGMGGAGWAPLHLAARRGSPEIVLALLDAGADIDRRDGRNGWTPLLHAIHLRNRRAAATLLDFGAAVDRRGDGGVTPLFMAAGYGMDGVVRHLLERGADPRAEIRGVNALWAAAGGGAIRDFADGPPLGHCFPEVMDTLLRAAPDLRVEDGLWARILKWVANDHCEQVVVDLLAGDFVPREEPPARPGDPAAPSGRTPAPEASPSSRRPLAEENGGPGR